MTPPQSRSGASGASGEPARRGRPNSASGSDPRSFVTPDAFTVSTALFGTPLATPGRRLAAILIDLVIIGLVTVVTKSFALVLGVAAAMFFVRAGFKRIPVRGSVFGRAMRFSVGCLGLFIGFLTIVVWASIGFDIGVDRGGGPGGGPGTPVRVGLREALGGAAGGMAFANAPDAASAEDAARSMAELGASIGLEPPEVRALLTDLVPVDAPWAPRADELIGRAVAQVFAAAARLDRAAVGGALEDPTDTLEPIDVVAGEEVTDPAADSIARLLGRIETLEGEVTSSRLDMVEALRVRETQESGLITWLRNVADDLGFGFGWATLYMTAILPWLKGQTVGKRLLGIRVVRLDGEPITWWTAFERAGGYAAGFATGLLGFAQIFWDANRQAIHDRIVGTVVVRDGAKKVIDWESAL